MRRLACFLKEKQVRALKDVHCYDWKTLVEKGELDTLKVPEVDKYIEHNKLSKNGKKIDKIKRITVHYYETSKESTFPSSVRTVMRVTVTMTLFCVIKVKAKVNQMMTVVL